MHHFLPTKMPVFRACEKKGQEGAKEVVLSKLVVVSLLLLRACIIPRFLHQA